LIDHNELTMCLRRALRWRAVGLVALVALPCSLIAELATSPPLAVASIVLAVPLIYAGTWGTMLRVDLVADGTGPDAATVLEVVAERVPLARIVTRKKSKLVIEPPAHRKYRLRIEWGRGAGNGLRVETDAPAFGWLVRSLLLARADEWRSVVDGLVARGYTFRD
jgi:hypothetical protein